MSRKKSGNFTREESASIGWTLIELLLVISLVLTLPVLAKVTLEYFRKNVTLSDAANEVAALLISAQSKTIAGEDGSRYQVQFDQRQAILVRDDGTPLSRVILDPSLEIVLPVNPIIFNKVTGTSSGGLVTLQTLDQGQVKQVTVSTLGKITVQ